MTSIQSQATYSELPGVSFTFDFEIIPRIDEHLKWTGKSSNLWLACSAIYIITIFYIQREMRTKKPYNLRLALATWNIGLTLFSACIVIRLAPDLINTIQSKGFYSSFCDASSFNVDFRLKSWMWFFCLSKLVEFGDTLFIVLRKQQLIFLHWFHHVTTLLYANFVIGNYLPAHSRWFITVNAAIHTIMYAYYAARALRFRFPRVVNMSITTMQILQMIAGLAINGITLYHQKNDRPCDGHPNASYFGFAVYTSFFILFAQFFISSYLTSKPKKSIIEKTD